jgi:hypothetical protein
VSQSLLANAAAELDGIELDFYGDRCGKKAYRIKKDLIGTFHYWEAYFYDWHDGWIRINRWPGEKLRKEAIEICNQHAIDKRLINFLPHRPKFKSTGYCFAAAQAQLASAVTFGFFGLF